MPAYPGDTINWKDIEEIDEWLDSAVSRAYKDQPLAQDWARIAKLKEERGEVIARDKDIVDACEVLLGIPRGPSEDFAHSGTWTTIRYARSQGKPVAIAWPNGHLTYEN